MKVPLVDLSASWVEVEVDAQKAVKSVIGNCAFAGNPPVVREFEQQFASYCGARHGVAVGSGTAALEVVLRAYKVGPGDEVILPANTYVAAAEAICLVGARPVFVDVNIRDASLELDQVESSLNDCTRGIIPVHLYGQPGNLEPVLELARRRGLWVVEDGSQAHGATWKGRRVGNLADAACFSFYPSKNLGAAGEAGCITTDDPELADLARKIADHGSTSKYHHEYVGRNDRMDGIQAALLAVRLPRLDTWNRRRREVADYYRRAFAGNPRIQVFDEHPEAAGVYHLFVVRVPNRDLIREQLERKGISTGLHYPIPLHLQPAYKSFGSGEGSLPVCEQLASEVLSLPMYPQLSDLQAEYVADQLIQLLPP